jgi:hypothetical protein
LIINYCALFHKNYTVEKLDELIDVDKNFIARSLDKMKPLFDEFNKLKLIFPTKEDLETVSLESADVENWKRTHFILDGTDIRIKQKIKDFKLLTPDSFKSKKLNFKNGVKFQVAISLDSQIIFCDDGNPGGVHDLRALWRSNFHFGHLNLTGLVDTGYINRFYPVKLIFPSKGTDLSEYQKTRNALIQRERGKIEKVFGLLKSRFECFSDGYRFPLRTISTLFKYACVATNYIRTYTFNYNNEDEEINEIIRTQNENLTDNDFNFQSIEDTFPEVRILENGEHQINIESNREEEYWNRRLSRRNRQRVYNNSNNNYSNNNSNFNNNSLSTSNNNNNVDLRNLLSAIQNTNQLINNFLQNFNNNSNDDNNTNLVDIENESNNVIIGPRILYGPPTWQQYYDNIEFEDEINNNQNYNEVEISNFEAINRSNE